MKLKLYSLRFFLRGRARERERGRERETDRKTFYKTKLILGSYSIWSQMERARKRAKIENDFGNQNL